MSKDEKDKDKKDKNFSNNTYYTTDHNTGGGSYAEPHVHSTQNPDAHAEVKHVGDNVHH